MSEDIPEKAFLEFKKAIEKRGLAVSPDALDALRKRLETKETKEEIRRALRAGEKSPSDVTKGMETLAIGVAERLQAKKTKTAQLSDIDFAIRLHWCKVWPICRPKREEHADKQH